MPPLPSRAPKSHFLSDMTSDYPIFALWAHPRSLSTVTERIFMERGDLHIFHEPFSVLYYVAEGRGTAVPSGDTAAYLKDYPSVKESILAKAKHQAVFLKDMPHHCYDHLAADEAFLQKLKCVFLIREPAATIASHYAQNPAVLLEEIGYEQEYKLFEKVQAAQGAIPCVVDAADLQSNPEGIIRAMCDHIGLPFILDSLSWEKGQPKEWEAWASWHQDAADSTAVFQRTKHYDVTVQNNKTLSDFYTYHLPFYEKLVQHKIQPASP